MSGATDVPVKTLLLTVFNSIIEVFLLCIAGYVLSRAGVTDKATQRKLNVINVSLFTPALLFSKVAFSLTPAKLKEMWIIPLGFVLISGLSAAVAWVMAKMFRLKKSQTAFAICAAMFQNSNSLPIALIQSLVMEVPGLKWGKDDTKDQMLGRALTYLVLYSTLGMMLRWSWGVKILSQADEEAPEVASVLPEQPYRDEPESTAHQVTSPEALETHPGARETDPFFSSADNIARDQAEERRNPSRDMNVARQTIHEGSQASHDPWRAAPPSALSAHSLRRPASRDRGGSHSSSRAGRSPSVPSVPEPHRRRDSSRASLNRRKPTRTESGMHFLGLPDFPKRERIMLPEDSSDEGSEDDEEVDEEWGSLTGSGSLRRRVKPVKTGFKAFMEKAKVRTGAALKSINAFMTVPMYAALLSIFIALVPPLQRTLNELDPLERAIKSAGSCSIPVTLVVLGAFFYTPPAPADQAGTGLANGGPKGSRTDADASSGNWLKRKIRALKPQGGGSSAAYPGENKAVFVAVMSRMVITPLLLLPLIALIARYDLFEAAEDPVFILSAVLLVSSPPALTLAQITQAASGDAFERLISKTISWSYAVLTPPLTLAYVVIGLIFGRL